MRTIPPEFTSYHYSRTKEPRIVVEVRFANDDFIYITSHADVEMPFGAVVFPGYLSAVTGTTQKIEPDQGRSTIGAIDFKVVDHNSEITNLLNAKEEAGKGARYKRVRVYMGFFGMEWSVISQNIIQTQIVDDLIWENNGYTFKCADIQRTVRKNIFVFEKTTLSQTIDATQLLIPVFSVDGFNKVEHLSSYSDGPNSEVGYIKIDDEVIRWTGTTTDGTLGLCFVANARGALNTKPAEHKVDTATSSDRKTEVKEFMYLELPAAKLAYAILTGNLYGQPGKELPNGWHLNISGDYIRTADFVNIGKDLWDPADDSAGFIVKFTGQEDLDAKKFLETEINLLIACYMPIYSNGELGLRRFTSVLHQAPYVFKLNEDNVKKIGALQYDLKAVSNLLSIEWNYDFIKEKLTRQKIILDQDSIDKYESSPAKSLQFNGLHGSRHTTTIIGGLFDRLRDRYAAPPERVNVDCLPYCNFIEVGDLVQLELTGTRDYFTNGSIARTFEVQQVSIDWIKGDVRLSLFGSTQPASVITPDSPGNGNPDPTASVLPNSFYTDTGVNITTLGAAVTTTLIGSVRHITGGTGIVGSDTLGPVRIYCDGDLELDSGVTLNFSKNVILAVKGHFQINGILNGKGGGMLGAAAVVIDENTTGGFNYENWLAHNDGESGYIGPTVSGGGYSSNVSASKWGIQVPGYTVPGAVSAVPPLNIVYENSTLTGLPSNLKGTGGASGHNVQYLVSAAGTVQRSGGAGASGGAGINIVCRGADFGSSGRIITSGNDGQRGHWDDKDGVIFYAGSGAGGAPGAIIILVDGINNSVPSIGYDTVEAKFGLTPYPPISFRFFGPNELPYYPKLQDGGYYPHYAGYGENPPDLSLNGSAVRVIYIPPTNIPVEDTPDEAPGAISIAVAELINTPRSAAGNLSTIEVTITPPSSGAYAYSNVYYRVKGQTGWVYSGVADDEWDIIVASDGKTYEVTAHPVSVSKVESSDGPIVEITVIDVINPPADDNTIPGALPVPNVSGLEIANQGADTNFVGTDLNLVWRRASNTDWIPLSVNTSIVSGADDLYFSHYQVIVTDYLTGEKMREQTTTAPAFKYTYAMNAEDTQKLDGTSYTQPRRKLIIEVYRWSKQSVRSLRAAKIIANNPAPEAPTGVSITAGALSFVFDFVAPTDPDWAGIKLHASTVTGFTPGPTNLISNGSSTGVVIQALTDTDYYIRFIPYDSFGDGDISAEYHIKTLKVEGADLSGLGPWATKLDPLDAAWILAQFQANAIDSTRIANLTAAKLTAGVILVTLTLQSTGNIQVVNGSFVTTIGIHNVSGTNYAIRTFDGASSAFSVTDNGILRATGAIISGAVTITGGSGYANLTDKPTNLSGINGTEGTKLGGIAAGADVTNSVLTTGTTITGGGITMSAGGSIKGGKTAPGSGNGFFLGYSGGAYQFDVGDTTAEKYMRFDGTDLLLGRKTRLRSVSSMGDDDIFDQFTAVSLAEIYIDALLAGGAGYNIVAQRGDVNGSSKGGELYIPTGSTGTLVAIRRDFPTAMLITPSFANYIIWTHVITFGATWDALPIFQIGVGDNSSHFIGFYITNAGIYARTQASAGSITTSALIFAFAANTKVVLKLETRGSSGAPVDFYINGTLAVTISTTIPTTGTAAAYMASLSCSSGSRSVNTNIFLGAMRYLQKTY